MPQLTLYHAVPSRSMIVRWMLEEIGEPYEVKRVDLKAGDNRQPAYLAINPMGKVPTLRHGDAIITEAAAICCYLADAFPEPKLAIPIGQTRRGLYLKWLFFGPSCLEPAVIDRTAKRVDMPRSAGWGDFDTIMDVTANAVAPGPYLLGEAFTAADVVIGSGLRWGMMTDAIPERAEFKGYVARLAERPALQRAMDLDGKLMAQQASG